MYRFKMDIELHVDVTEWRFSSSNQTQHFEIHITNRHLTLDGTRLTNPDFLGSLAMNSSDNNKYVCVYVELWNTLID